MLKISNSTKISVPILTESTKNPTLLLGTGFLISKDQVIYLVTAKHIFNNYHDNVRFTIFPDKNGKLTVLDVPILLKNRIDSKDFDICIIRITEFVEYLVPYIVELTTTQVEPFDSVATHEFSRTTYYARTETELAKISFEPKYLRGNILRYYISDFPERVPTLSLELSFPILQGASGSPVVISGKKEVIGILVSSIETQVQPAQTITLFDNHGKPQEEIKYFLPTSKAIAAKHIEEFLNQL